MPAAILQLIGILFVGGLGRLYTGHTTLGIVQLALSLFGVGQLWSFLDGIYILAKDKPRDSRNRILMD